MNDSMEQVRAVILATGNAHKVEEVRQILELDVPFLTLKDFPEAPSPDETGETFRENAAIKAISLAAHIGTILKESRALPPALIPTNGRSRNEMMTFMRGVRVLADDSGIEVRTLAWAPGVYSARFAALDSDTPRNSTDTENTAKLLRLLKDVPLEERQARFRCVIAMACLSDFLDLEARPLEINRSGEGMGSELNHTLKFFEGICPGRITLGTSGSGGFGYDPVFIADGTDATFAMISPEEKNRISHRGHALERLAAGMKFR